VPSVVFVDSSGGVWSHRPVPGTGEVALHPWNRGFSWTASTGTNHHLTRSQVERFDTQGYVVVPDFLSPAELERVVPVIDGFEAEIDSYLRHQEGERALIAEAGAITFATHLVARSPVLRELSTHPFLLGACADLIGPDVNMYWDQAVYKKPEKPRRFPWHQDNGYAFVVPQQYLTCWIALTDATTRNGCPQVAPGLHRLGTLAHTWVDPLGWQCFDAPPEQSPAELPAGGVVLFSSLTPHMTGPNTTDTVRKAYIVQYAPAGAEVLHGDPAAEPARRVPADDADRQYPVLRGGAAVRP
jgi:phytanoyl-CoA hydroxylase